MAAPVLPSLRRGVPSASGLPARGLALGALSAGLLLATGCFGGSTSDGADGADEAYPDMGAVPSRPDPSETRDRPRPSLGRSALRGVVMAEGEHLVLATCRGERVLLFDGEDAPYVYDGELPAMAGFEVERVAVDASEIRLGVEGAARIQGVIEKGPFEPGDCDLPSAEVAFPEPPAPSITLLESRRRASRFGIQLPATWPDAPPLSQNEFALLEVAGATRAYCREALGVHRTFWEIETADGDFLGAWFMPCVIAERIAARSGEGSERSWTITGEDGTDTVYTGQRLAPSTAVRLLGVRDALGGMKVQCAGDGRCPVGHTSDDPGAAAKQAMTVKGDEE